MERLGRRNFMVGMLAALFSYMACSAEGFQIGFTGSFNLKQSSQPSQAFSTIRTARKRLTSLARWEMSEERGEALLAATNLKPEDTEMLKLSDINGEWRIIANRGMAALPEGASLVVDSAKELALIKSGAQSTTVQLVVDSGDTSMFRIAPVASRVAVVVKADAEAKASETGEAFRVLQKKADEIVFLGVEGSVVVSELVDPKTEIKPWDLPGYYQGFFSDRRMEEEARAGTADQLDNVTPNIKLAASVTAVLVGMVAFFLVSNPPPPSNVPLTVKSRAARTTGEATIDKQKDPNTSLGR